MVERVEQAQASVLHQRPYRETSLLIELFSRDYGVIGLVANGARRPKSRLRPLLQPLQELSVSWTQRGELGTLRQAEQAAPGLSLRGDGLYAGLYMNELLMRLCVRGDPHPELYDRYRQALQALQGAVEPGISLRLFERDLLEAIGYGLQLQHEADSGKAIEPGQRYRFHSHEGGRPLAPASEDDTHVSGAALLALQAGDLSDPQLRAQAKRILATAINHLLDNRPLRTVQMLRELRRGQPRAVKEAE